MSIKKLLVPGAVTSTSLCNLFLACGVLDTPPQSSVLHLPGFLHTTTDELRYPSAI